jgi:hypothetical protein
MKIRVITTLLATAMAASVAIGQEVTPIWVQHLEDGENTGLINVAPENKLPILIRRTPLGIAGTEQISDPAAYPMFQGGSIQTDYGRSVIMQLGGFYRYDDAHYLLAVVENGIDEANEPDLLDEAALVPDRCLVWIDATTGALLGIAKELTTHPLGITDPTLTGEQAGEGNALGLPADQWIWGGNGSPQRHIGSNKLSMETALDDGAYGEKVLYSGFEHRILRWAPNGTVEDANFPSGRPVWADLPTLAWVEPVPGEAYPTIVPGEEGTEPGLSGGDQSNNWRWEVMHAKGVGDELRITAGGSTWRASMHVQEFVTDNGGLTLRPINRSSCRSGGNKGGYSQGGQHSSTRTDANDPERPGLEWYINGRFPGTGWGARPTRYVNNPNQTVTDTIHFDLDGDGVPDEVSGDNIRTNRFMGNEGALDGTAPWAVREAWAYGNAPGFCWESAGTCGNSGPDHSIDGLLRYDGNWSIASDTADGLDYIVNYSFPSWNNQFGGPPAGIAKPGWVSVHTLDGKIAPNANSWKLPLTEWSEWLVGNTGHGAGYAGDMHVYPDPGSPANQKSTVLVAMGEYGFGVFSVEIKPIDGSLTTPDPVDVEENRPYTLSSVFTGSGTPLFYKWQKDNGGSWEDVPGESGNVAKQGEVVPVTLSVDLASLSDSGSYRVVVTNQLGSVESAAVSVSVNSDDTAPTLVSVTSIENNAVVLHFNEILSTNDLAEEGIFDVFNYSVEDLSASDLAGVVGIQVFNNGTSVRLALNPDFPLTGGDFRVSVSALGDLKGNLMTDVLLPHTVAGQFADNSVYDGGAWSDTKWGSNQQGYHYIDAAGLGADNQFEVLAGGRDIWSADEALNFLYKEVVGDFDYKIRVKNTTRGDNRSGILATQSLLGDDLMASTLSHGRQEPARTLVGSFARTVAGAAPFWVSPPNSRWDTTFKSPDVWLRLTRNGDTFRHYKSHDGSTWEADGVVEVPMVDPIFFGVATAAAGGTSTTHTTYSELGTGLSLFFDGSALSWSGGKLQTTPNLNPPVVWTDVDGATSPYTVPAEGGLFRLEQTP